MIRLYFYAKAPNGTRPQLLLKSLAEKVKVYRLAKGVTQSQAYADTGIHFGRIEQGKRDVSYTTLISLVEYLEIEIRDLV